MDKLLQKYKKIYKSKRYHDFIENNDTDMIDATSVEALLAVAHNVKSSLRIKCRLSDSDLKYVEDLLDENIVIFDRGYDS